MTSSSVATVSPVDSKQRVALYSLVAAIILLLLKIAVGLATGSLGILAEAAHSALDLLATILTYTSIRVAARPADVNHPFGHGKFENFSAFVETGLLLLTSIAIAYAAGLRWWRGDSLAHITVAAFAVMLVSMGVDLWRSRALTEAARKYDSDALEADALNFASDLWSSGAVLLGLVLAYIGQHFGLPVLLHADTVAACFVALALVLLAWRLGRRTAGVLLDEAPGEVAAQLRQRMLELPGVVDVERVRLRKAGGKYFVDVLLAVERTLTLMRARQVRDEVSAAILRHLPGSDVVVDTHPERPASGSIFENLRAIAQRHNVGVHDLAVYDVGGTLDIELHLEVDEQLPLKQAHDLVTAIETQMRDEVPKIRQIITHIEPELADIPRSDVVDLQRISRKVQHVAASFDGLLDCHDVQVRVSRGHLSLSCHCTFPDTMPVARVHEVVTALEGRIKREIPQLLKVTIHTEPGSDNRR